MLRTVLIAILAVAAAQASVAQPSQQAAASLGCVRSELLACGCHLRITNLQCPAQFGKSAPHLFTGLEPKDPLHLQFDGEELELPHKIHHGSATKGDRPGSWTDEYASDRTMVRIRYAPGPNTCPKTRIEGCEYTDYVAKITIQRTGRPAFNLAASASCGC